MTSGGKKERGGNVGDKDEKKKSTPKKGRREWPGACMKIKRKKKECGKVVKKRRRGVPPFVAARKSCDQRWVAKMGERKGS